MDVIEGSLEQEEPRTQISNQVIMGKKWDQEAKGRPDALASGERVQIRRNRDLRPLSKAGSRKRRDERSRHPPPRDPDRSEVRRVTRACLSSLESG